MAEIGILGAGAAGISMAQALAYAGHTVTVWDANKEVLQDIQTYREHRRGFPGVTLHPGIHVALTPEDVVGDITFVAVPVQAQTELAAEVWREIPADGVLVHVAAGVRGTDGALMTKIWDEVAGKPLNQVVVAGPNFALEVLEQKFTAVVVAGPEELAWRIAQLFEGCEFLRPYVSEDVIGVQIGAAVRHVMAMAAGMADGLGLGRNAQAAVMCRGLAEMTRLAEALGGKRETLMGLAGLGEMILHAPSKLSRNYRFGVLVAERGDFDKAVAEMGQVDGVAVARMMAYLAAANGLDLAIVSAMDGIVNGDLTPAQAFEFLKRRPIQTEF